jgi:hypothetical protein
MRDLDSPFAYDVAFSFLSEDEGTASQLNDLLKPRLTTFFYAERQKEVAFKDGEATYREVFAQQSRAVVVLYRAGWGERRWTAIEKDGIRSRALNEGYGYRFVCFVRMDDPQTAPLPKWFPETALWFDLKRWGIEAAAAAIEQRAQEFGGRPHTETAVEAAARIRRDNIAESERQAFLESQAGVQAAEVAFEQIFEAMNLISGNSSDLILLPQKLRSHYGPMFELVAKFDRWRLTIQWEKRYSNTTKESQLVISEWDGVNLNYPDERFEGMSGPKRKTRFVIDQSNGVVGWRERSTLTPQFRSSADVADWAAKQLLNRLSKKRL